MELQNTTFNNNACKSCQMGLGQVENKITLHHLLPSNVCDLIGGFAKQKCKRCEYLKSKEDAVSEFERLVRLSDPTTAEKQIHMCKRAYKQPVRYDADTMGYHPNESKREIETFLNTDSFKNECTNKSWKTQRLATISYLKKQKHFTIEAISNCHNANKLKALTRHRIDNSSENYTFRNQTFKAKDLVREFIAEFIHKLMEKDENICDEWGLYEWSVKAFGW